MRKEGLPVDGCCVAAGIPSSEKAAKTIDALKTSGAKYVALNLACRWPSSDGQYHQGKRRLSRYSPADAGCHHSYEDFH
jgi:enoyl reductase-like protein